MEGLHHLILGYGPIDFIYNLIDKAYDFGSSIVIAYGTSGLQLEIFKGLYNLYRRFDTIPQHIAEKILFGISLSIPSTIIGNVIYRIIYNPNEPYKIVGAALGGFIVGVNLVSFIIRKGYD